MKLTREQKRLMKLLIDTARLDQRKHVFAASLVEMGQVFPEGSQEMKSHKRYIELCAAMQLAEEMVNDVFTG